jgi:hypothetical protein
MKTLLDTPKKKRAFIIAATAVIILFALLIATGKAQAAQSIALTGIMPAAGYQHNPMPVTPYMSNNIINAAKSINLTGQIQTISKGAGATAAIPAGSINLTGILPAGAQGLTASNGGQGIGVMALEGLGYLFTVKLLTLHF